MKRQVIAFLVVVSLIGCCLTGCRKKQEDVSSQTDWYEALERLGDFTLRRMGAEAKEYGADPEDYCIVKYTGAEETPAIPTRTEDGVPITAIGKWAFSGNEAIREVIIPDGCRAILSQAFYNCKNLTYVRLGADVSYVSEWETFSACRAMEKYEVSEENLYFYAEGNCLIDRRVNGVVYGCGSSVIPDGIERIGSCAFSEAGMQKEIRIPESVKEIGFFAFYGSEIFGAYLPKSVILMKDGAFSQCPGARIRCEAESQPVEWSGIWTDGAGSKYEPPAVEWDAHEKTEEKR